MRPLEERLNDRLEQMRAGQSDQHLSGFVPYSPDAEQDPELESLVALARHLQTMRQIQVDPNFAHRLEHRVILRAARLRMRGINRKRAFLPFLRFRPALAAVLGLCLLFIVLSTGLLAFAAQVTNPSNPLYGLKRWEQHVQISLAGGPSAQVALDFQFARDSLHMLSMLATPSHAAAYEQALADLNQHLQNAATVIDTLPAGAQRAQLSDELTSVQANAVHVLRGLLSGLALPERLATTAQLARLGDTVPRLNEATLIFPSHSNGRTTLTLSGSDLQAGAQLLIDDRLSGVFGTLQNGQLVFAFTNWQSSRHPHRLILLNPDGTAAQINSIRINTEHDNNNNNGNSNGSNGDNNDNNGENNGHGNSGNGNGSGKGNGDGNRPATTPTPHH